MKDMKLLFAACVALFPSMAFSVPGHDHCQTVAWAQLNSTLLDPPLTDPPLVDPVLPANYRPGENSGHIDNFQFKINLKSEPPPSATEDCFYEISDITRVSAIFVLDSNSVMSWKSIVFGSPAGVSVTPVVSTSRGNIVTMTFSFEPHLGQDAVISGPIEVVSPSGPFYITLFDDNDAFSITSASIFVAGNHYYLPRLVSEPGVMALLLAVLAAFPRRPPSTWRGRPFFY